MAKKVQFNAQVFEGIATEFCDWEDLLTGDKGEKVGAALLAIQALFQIDRAVLYDLMRADATIVQAKQLIIDKVVEAATIQEFGSLKAAAEEAQVILDAVRQQAKEVSGTKKKPE